MHGSIGGAVTGDGETEGYDGVGRAGQVISISPYVPLIFMKRNSKNNGFVI